MGPVTCHAVGAVDGAQSDGVGIGSEVTHDPNTADVRQAGKVLPDTAVKTGFGNFFAEDGIGFADNGKFFFRDFTKDADGKTRSREGLTPNKFTWNAEFFPNGTDFILKERTQWFDEVKVHVFRQAADVMVALDSGTGAGAARFNDVRVDSALNEVIDMTDFLGFFLQRRE